MRKATSSEESFQVTVQAVNDAPLIEPIDDQASDQDEIAGPFPFLVRDVDDSDWDFVVLSSNESLIRSEDIVIDGAGANRTISLTPQLLAYGETDITITVTDTGGLSDSETFHLIVNLVNQPPTITSLDDQSTDEDVALGPLAFTISDGESQEADLMVTAVSSDESVISNAAIQLGGVAANRTLTMTPQPDASGTTEITVTVTDEGGLSSVETFLVTVDPVNDAPMVSDPGPQATDEDQTLQVPLTLTDPDAVLDDLIVEATSSNALVIDAAGLSFNGGGADRILTLTPLANQFGESTITVSVRDDQGALGSVVFDVVIAPVNDAPQVIDSIADGEVLGFQRISLPLPAPLFEDIDDTSLAYSLSTTDGAPVEWLTLDDQRIFGRPSNTDAGALDLKVTATDLAGATAEALFTVEVVFNEFPWHNFADSTDINDDGVLTPQDVSLQLGYLVLNGSGVLPASGPNRNALRLVDATRDNRITPQDLARVVAELFLQAEGEGEGEVLAATGAAVRSRPNPSLQADEADRTPASSLERESLTAANDLRRQQIWERYESNDRDTRLKDLALALADWWLQ